MTFIRVTVALSLSLAGCGDEATHTGTDAGTVASDGGSGGGDAGPRGLDAAPRDGGSGRDAGSIPTTFAPPIGIPTPEFGVEETVDSTCGTLTSRTFEGLDALSGLPAGTVVEIPPGTHDAREVLVSGDGTACEPIIVRGQSDTERTVIRSSLAISGSYVIVENLELDLSTSDQHRVGIVDADHVALRHSEVHGSPVGRNTTIVFISGSSHVVIWNDHIHDNGDFGLPGEIDVHGIGAGNSWDVWIVDNHLHHNRGDGMQFGHRANNTLGRIYIGRNDIHDNGENSVDIKEASNVVISQNVVHGETEGNVVLHDCPVNAALIFNESHDAPYGVSLPSLESNCDDELPVTLLVLGNDFHDLTGAGVQGWGSGKRYFISGNTFRSVGSRIDVDPQGPGSRVSEDDSALEDGFAAFEAIYGIDIRP